MAYPEKDVAYSYGVVEWSSRRLDHAAGDRQMMVPVVCGVCGKRRMSPAHDVARRAASPSFSARCRGCEPRERWQARLDGLRARGIERLEGGVIEWPSAGQHGNTLNWKVVIRCDCGHSHLVLCHNARKASGRCTRCALSLACGGEKNGRWKNGHLNGTGYRVVYIPATHPLASMAEFRGASNVGKILEHRLVAADHLGRTLASWEHVHHRNGDKLDNRPENLEVLAPGKHHTVTTLQRSERRLRAENARLRGLVLLLWQMATSTRGAHQTEER